MKCVTKSVDECSMEERLCFFQLMQIDFNGVTFDNFIRDFSEKQFVMILKNDSGEIVGFSTLMELEIFLEEKVIKIIFSGDTAVLHEFRDSFGFGFELSKFFIRAINLYPSYEIYYALISKGWRTYRVLPFYFKEFFPCYSRSISSYERSLINAFGYKKYPNNYVEETGLLKFSGETERLKPESMDASLPSRKNPHIDFFFKNNPGYLDGTELVSLARVSLDNFTSVVSKLISINEKTKEVV